MIWLYEKCQFNYKKERFQQTKAWLNKLAKQNL